MSVDRLRGLIDFAPHLGVDGEWLAPRLRHYAAHAHEGVTLNQALGVAGTRGQRPWWIQEKRERTIEALASLGTCTTRESYRGRADEILAMLRRYRSARWRQDRNATTTPNLDPVRAAARGTSR